MLKVWGRATSNNVQKVLWCCEEIELAYELEEVGGPFGGTDAPAYLAMNPTGLVPTISEDGFSLWESNTIVRYLSSAHGAGCLSPRSQAERALAELWMDYQLGTLWPAFRGAFLGLTRTPPERRDPAGIRLSLERTAGVLAVLDTHLDGRRYVAGDDLTVGDVALGPMVYRWLNIDIERPALPNLEAWHARLTDRPAYQRTVMVPFTVPFH